MSHPAAALQQRLQALLPGLIGLQLTEVGPEGKSTTTLESSTKFIGAAKVGSTVSGESVPLHKGRTTMVWQTTIRNDAGKLCAVVTQTQLVLG